MSSVSDIVMLRKETRPMRSPAERAVKLHAAGFQSGRVEMLAKCYDLPLPVYMNDEVFVIESEQKFIELISGYRYFVMKDGLAKVHGELIDEFDDGDHMLITTRFTFEYADGRKNEAVSTRYARKSGNRLIVEMVDNETFPHHVAKAV